MLAGSTLLNGLAPYTSCKSSLTGLLHSQQNEGSAAAAAAAEGSRAGVFCAYIAASASLLPFSCCGINPHPCRRKGIAV